MNRTVKRKSKIFALMVTVILAMLTAGCGKGQEVSEESETTIEMQKEEQEQPEEAEQEEPEEAEQEELAEEVGVKFVSWEDAGLEDHVMDWKDDALAAVMQKKVGKEEIMLSDVWELTEFGGYFIYDISSLSELTNLTELRLYDSSVSDISSLSGLTNLTKLDLYSNSISDISSLSGLTNLTDLSLCNTSVSDISSLYGLTNLKIIWCSGNPIEDAALEALQERGVCMRSD